MLKAANIAMDGKMLVIGGGKILNRSKILADFNIFCGFFPSHSSPLVGFRK